MIIVDYSGIAISNIFTMKEEPSEHLIRHMILNSLRMYNLKYREEYGQMIIACDGGSTWRKQLFPQYKANRKKSREEGGLDWKEFFRILDTIREEIKTNLPYKTVHIQGVEADDVIATLVESTQEFGNHEPVMIISSDKDFVQLQRYDNVKQFSPMAKSLVKEKDPIRALQEKVLRGDSGDGVPNVLSPDDVFVSGGRQKPVSAKRLAEWISGYSNLEKTMTSEEYRNFCRNRNLIDMDYIPAEKKSEIMRVYGATQTHSNILQYLISKRCTQLISCAEEFQTHERNAHL